MICGEVTSWLPSHWMKSWPGLYSAFSGEKNKTKHALWDPLYADKLVYLPTLFIRFLITL